ncbi:MAG: 6-carboxytetrahydropterin synthase [SAR202 cluster bacterium]|jgi:6-pyruvoyltetrahydropterin/6-carboxytetrahydropterin synthase|nr:6-carboxytetrahydropterin synthase [SAR202 cluster bacterium]
MRPSVEEIEITKAFRFEAAHRMAKGYIGKCSNIHGHSWRGELSVICSKLDEYGMGIDFYQLDQFLNQIIEYFDHKIILFKEDTELIRLCDLSKWSYVVLMMKIQQVNE